MADETRSYSSHIQSETDKRDRKERRIRVREGVKECARCLSRGRRSDYYTTACICRDILIPALIGNTPYSLDEYHELLKDKDEWDYTSLNEFKNYPNTYTQMLAQPPDAGQYTRNLSLSLHGYRTESGVTKKTVESAYDSLVEIAEWHDIIREEMKNSIPALGYSMQIGKLYKKFDWNLGDEVQVVARPPGDYPKTLYIGSTGSGKSSSMGTEVFDRWMSGFKVIDLVDTDEFENSVYDIPQHNGEIDSDSVPLAEIREEHGLPATFEDSDELGSPDIEIMVPMTRDINDRKWPFDTQAGEFKVTPFTIPAGHLDQTSLMDFLTAMMTDNQASTVRTAMREVQGTGMEWTLKDLAKAVAGREELDENYRKRVVRQLSNLQSGGYIRSSGCEHAIDWERIFNDQDTITVFSTAHINERAQKLMVISYLMKSVYEQRKEFGGLPPLALVMRELHEFVPHRNEKLHDKRAEELQSSIASSFSYILKKNRHENIEVLADTQDLMDLKFGVRKRFTRFVAFKLPDDSLKEAFKYAGENKFKVCKNSIGVETAVGAVIGMTKPNLDQGLPFISPVKYFPSPHHTMHTDEESTGFEARERYLEHEELRQSDWDSRLPDDLEMDSQRILNEAEGDNSTEPVQIFVKQCVDTDPPVIETSQGDREQWENTDTVMEAYNNWADSVNAKQIGSKSALGRRLQSAIPGLGKPQRRKQIGTTAYLGVMLNDRGQEFTMDDIAGPKDPLYD